MENPNTIYQREWYRKHADKINMKRRTKVMCPTCQNLFNRSSLRKHQLHEQAQPKHPHRQGILWNNIFINTTNTLEFNA